MARALPFCLMLITDEAPDLLARVSSALDGCAGSRVAVQLRLKTATAIETFEIARALRAITRQRNALLFINDRVDIARLVDADGVHLPQQGLPVEEVRRLLLLPAWVGRSCHSRAELSRAEAEGASYATLSPVHAVPGKGQALGIADFGALTNETKLPIVALGGLSAADVPALTAHGARAFAVIRAILGASDPARASAHFMSSLVAAGHETT
jgi:thiamine-phosphate pyrophosphorylase